MATTVTHIVDPDGGASHDYDSLYLWNAGEQGDLTGARDEIAVATCRCTGGTADATATQISGWTTSATQYIKIWTNPAESYRHNGSYQTGNKYLLSGGDASIAALIIYEDFVRLDGLQVRTDSSSNHSIGVYIGVLLGAGSVIHVSNHVGYQNNTSTNGGPGIYIYDADVTVYIWNASIFFPSGATYLSSNNSGFAMDAGTVYIYSSTIIGGYKGMNRDGGTLTCKNVYVHGARSAGYIGFSGTIGKVNCASSDATADGTNPQINIAFSTSSGAYFTSITDATPNLHIGALSGLKDVGTDTSGESAPLNFTTDIDGQTRSGSWDIGADEYVAGGFTEGVDGIGPLLAGSASRFAMLNRDLGGDF